MHRRAAETAMRDMLSTRVLPAEREAVESAARRLGVTCSDFIRNAMNEATERAASQQAAA